MKRFLFAFLLFFVAAPVARGATGAAQQQAFRAAVEAVRDSVVQIRTVGGLDRVGRTLITQGPTTGLILSSDGYLVSSAFNFAQQPSSILVRLPSGKQTSAKLVARDKSRMLVLLKVDTEEPLPVPTAAPSAEIRVGQWAIALGRTFQSERVNVSVGIVSGLQRMYGRVLQTDASISVANYGGPLVDLHGRVLGVLVPMSPQATASGDNSEVAGAEFYDSGIGFAVPLERVLATLPRWRQGDDLLPGKLGVGLAAGEAHLTPPKIVSVWPDSPAAEAGWRPDDLIVAVDDHPVTTQAQLRFEIVPHYAGDLLRVTIRRDDQLLPTDVTLAGELAVYRHAFLGVLPSRQPVAEDSPGVVVRGVLPDSPAARGGIQRGDRIVRVNAAQVDHLDQVVDAIDALHPADAIEVVVIRNEQEVTLKTELTTVPEQLLSPAEWNGVVGSQADSNDKPEIGQLRPESVLQSLKLPEFSQPAKFYAPELGKKETAGLLLWLAEEDKAADQQRVAEWQAACHRDRLVLLLAHPQDQDAGWASDDLAYLRRLVRTARKRWRVDRRRLAVGGTGKAGQMAYALALGQRSTFAGAVGIDAPLPRTLRIPDTRPGRRLAVLAVESQNSSFAPLIREDVKQLREAGYPASWLQRSPAGDADLHESISRWLDGLDKF